MLCGDCAYEVGVTLVQSRHLGDALEQTFEAEVRAAGLVRQDDGEVNKGVDRFGRPEAQPLLLEFEAAEYRLASEDVFGGGLGDHASVTLAKPSL